MHPMTGLEILKHLRINTIFVTAHREVIYEVLDHENAIDCIVKPINFDRVLTAVKKVEARYNGAPHIIEAPTTEPDTLTLVTNRGNEMIPLTSITYIQAKKNYSAIYCGKAVKLATISLMKVEELLPASLFVRIHRSHIVAIDQISKSNATKVILKDGTALPVGRTYKYNFP